MGGLPLFCNHHMRPAAAIPNVPTEAVTSTNVSRVRAPTTVPANATLFSNLCDIFTESDCDI